MVAAKDSHEGYLPVRGGVVWYPISGASKQGLPLLVIHGGPGATHDYLEPLAALASDRPVIFYDQLGCGNSDDPALWQVDRFVAELQAVCTSLVLQRVCLLGRSWGALSAVKNLTCHVTGLVLSGPLLSSSRWVTDQWALLDGLPKGARQAVQEAEAPGNFDTPVYSEAMMSFYRWHLCRMEPPTRLPPANV